MSTEDDRPRHAVGGSFSRSSFFDDGTDFASQQTTELPGPSPYDAFTEEAPPQRKATTWHSGADLGLLVLRLVLGVLFIGHGLQHLFGWFQGRGLDGMADQLVRFGYTNETILAWVTGITELVGGTFVALGLFTPAGAGALLAVLSNAIIVKFNVHVFAGGIELESIFAAAAFAILFTGPGRVSLDRPTPWFRHAPAFGVVFFLLAAAASTTMLLVFRG